MSHSVPAAPSRVPALSSHLLLPCHSCSKAPQYPGLRAPHVEGHPNRGGPLLCEGTPTFCGLTTPAWGSPVLALFPPSGAQLCVIRLHCGWWPSGGLCLHCEEPGDKGSTACRTSSPGGLLGWRRESVARVPQRPPSLRLHQPLLFPYLVPYLLPPRSSLMSRWPPLPPAHLMLPSPPQGPPCSQVPPPLSVPLGRGTQAFPAVGSQGLKCAAKPALGLLSHHVSFLYVWPLAIGLLCSTFSQQERETVCNPLGGLWHERSLRSLRGRHCARGAPGAFSLTLPAPGKSVAWRRGQVLLPL